MKFAEWREAVMEQYSYYLTTGASDERVSELAMLYKTGKVESSSRIQLQAAYDTYLKPIILHTKDGIMVLSSGVRLSYKRDGKNVLIDALN